MRSLVRRARPASRDDQGFTLIEVVVAIVLLTMVSVAMLALFVRAMKGTAGLDRKQAAVAVAGQAIELARSVSAVQDPSVPSKLISGRTSTAVDSQWTAASAAAAWDSSQTDKASDASGATTPVVPLTSTSTVASVTYTAYTLVGTCWRPAT